MRAEGWLLPGGPDELRVLLKGFNGQTGCRMSAVVTRSGVPLAAVLPDEVPADNFATMAATLLGALEVIYSTSGGGTPEKVAVRSERGTLFVRAVTTRAFFVALAEGVGEDLQPHVDETATRARALLAKPS